MHCNCTLPKFETNIPRNETAWPRSQLLHSCICEQFIYSHDRSASQYSKIGGPIDIVRIYKLLTYTWMQKLGRRPRSFSSGNVCFEFSMQCEVWMCDSDASFLVVYYCPLVKSSETSHLLKFEIQRWPFLHVSSTLFVHKTNLEISHDWNKCFGHVSRQNWKWHRGAPRANITPFVRTEPRISVN